MSAKQRSITSSPRVDPQEDSTLIAIPCWPGALTPSQDVQNSLSSPPVAGGVGGALEAGDGVDKVLQQYILRGSSGEQHVLWNPTLTLESVISSRRTSTLSSPPVAGGMRAALEAGDDVSKALQQHVLGGPAGEARVAAHHIAAPVEHGAQVHGGIDQLEGVHVGEGSAGLLLLLQAQQSMTRVLCGSHTRGIFQLEGVHANDRWADPPAGSDNQALIKKYRLSGWEPCAWH